MVKISADDHPALLVLGDSIFKGGLSPLPKVVFFFGQFVEQMKLHMS